MAPQRWADDKTSLNIAKGIASMFAYLPKEGEELEVDGKCTTKFTLDANGVMTKTRTNCDHQEDQNVS